MSIYKHIKKFAYRSFTYISTPTYNTVSITISKTYTVV